MDHRNNKTTAYNMASGFAASLAEALTKATGTPVHAKVLDKPDLATRKGPPVHFRLTAAGSVHGACFVEFYEAQVAELAAGISGNAPAPFSDDQVETLGHVLSAAMDGFSAALTSEFGSISFHSERASDIGFGGMFVVALALGEGEKGATPLLLYFDGELMASLSQQTARGAENTSIDASNLRLVMDVELNVSLRFGQRQLPLRELLELTSGSVIGLDRQVDEPVELLLDGKVIARGEAVIVDGNYGLRITEVPRPIASHLTY
jgi:flagellar motor switch protein FliN/FliY